MILVLTSINALLSAAVLFLIFARTPAGRFGNFCPINRDALAGNDSPLEKDLVPD